MRSADDGTRCRREIELPTSLREQVDVGGHPVEKAMSLDRVPARKSKAERPGRVESDASELLVKWIHGEGRGL